MYGATVNPFSTAFFARRPAPIMTEGLLVLVQLVMAEITTDPVEWVGRGGEERERERGRRRGEGEGEGKGRERGRRGEREGEGRGRGGRGEGEEEGKGRERRTRLERNEEIRKCVRMVGSI